MNVDVYYNLLETFNNIFSNVFDAYEREYFMINILLVLGRIRLGYLCELSVYDNSAFLQIWNYLETVFIDTLSYKVIKNGIVLIYLTKNKMRIDNIFAGNSEDNALGIILGFVCVGSRWNDRTICRYGIYLYAKRDGRKKLDILSFLCPVETFTLSDKEDIFHIVVRYNAFLNNYGYNVTLECKMIPANMVYINGLYDINELCDVEL